MRGRRLPSTFDPARLRADLARVQPEEWTMHPQKRHYDGQWSGAARRSIAGAAGKFLPEAREGRRFAAAALLARCPYFQEVVATFQCPLNAMRFFLDRSRLVLAPGECWYTNVNLPHAVENTGEVDRIHLVLDGVVDDWLRAIFRHAWQVGAHAASADGEWRMKLESSPDPADAHTEDSARLLDLLRSRLVPIAVDSAPAVA